MNYELLQMKVSLPLEFTNFPELLPHRSMTRGEIFQKWLHYKHMLLYVEGMYAFDLMEVTFESEHPAPIRNVSGYDDVLSQIEDRRRLMTFKFECIERVSKMISDYQSLVIYWNNEFYNYGKQPTLIEQMKQTVYDLEVVTQKLKNAWNEASKG